MSRWFLLPLVLIFLTCRGQPGVLVDIGTWPESAESLRIDGSLNGVPFAEPLSYPDRPTRVVVYLSEGEGGQLHLDLTALGGDGCPRATGQTDVEVGGGLRRIAQAHVAMSAVTQPYCPPPQLDGIMPASGLNYSPTTLTISGSGFRAGVAVTVGGTPCTNVSVVSSTRISCTVPGRPGTCGPQAVVVTNSDSQAAMGKQFFYRAAAVSFAAQSILSGGGMGQRQLIAADFSGDGKLDLASANLTSNDVSVYLNDGQGGFAAAISLTVGNGPVGLAAGDLNRDNKLDIVTANAGSDTISFLAGDGLGGFSPAVNTTVVGSPQGVAIGDLSNDGIPDVVVTNLNTGNVAVFIGQGTGGLVPQARVSVGTGPRYGALADMNRDGHLDLVVANVASNDVSYRPGSGGARFGAGTDMAAGMAPVQAVVNDLNHDQVPDIVVANQDSSNVTVLLGTGAGSFTAASGSPFAVGSGPQGLILADIDGDGNLDILTPDINETAVTILAGDGAGGFIKFPNSPFAAAPNPFGIATGDFNGDGLIDFAIASPGVNGTIVRLAACN